MAKTKAQLLDEVLKELETTTSLCEKYAKDLMKANEKIEALTRFISRQNGDIVSLKDNKKCMQKHMNEWVFTQISRLEAVKMLWSIMAGAGTHREKAAFCQQALFVLDNEINNLKNGVHINSSDLPF